MSLHKIGVTVLWSLHDLDGPVAEPSLGFYAGETTFLICLQCLGVALRSTPIVPEAPEQGLHFPILENDALTPSGTRIDDVLPWYFIFRDGSSESSVLFFYLLLVRCAIRSEC